MRPVGEGLKRKTKLTEDEQKETKRGMGFSKGELEVREYLN